MDKIKFNLSKITGKVKPMHGINNLPYSPQDCSFAKKFLKDCGAPYCRLHDTMGAYGGSYYVDVPNIFRDFDADENDPANYDFYLTDEYIACIQESGCETFYRLGVTIEWASKKYRIHPPKDYAKWARICEHIIMHYTQGWADGFNYNIKYWEIWNEPENPPMWTGTKEEFFDLYATASKYLKSKFPHLSIGGYGSCGFYAVTRDNMSDFYKSFVPYFTDFLEYITKENAPLDFFSWHIYTESVEEVAVHAKHARDTLDKYGFTDTETFLNEWNFGDEGTSHFHKRTMVGAAFLASVMCKLQNDGNIDGAMYYALGGGVYNGLTEPVDNSYRKPMYSMMMFNDLYKKGDTIQCEHSIEGVYALGASDGKETAVLICNPSGEDRLVEVEFSGIKEGIELTMKNHLLNEESNAELVKTEIFRGFKAIPVIKLPKTSVVYLNLTEMEKNNE